MEILMIVAYCFTDNWAQYIPTQLYALLTNNPQVSEVYLVCSTKAYNSIIKDLIKVRPKQLSFIDSACIPKMHVNGRFTQATMYRLMLPEFLPGRKVLYLDADTIVVNKIPDIELEDNMAMAGAIDIGITPSYKKRIGLPPQNDYVNAGVLYMDFSHPCFAHPNKIIHLAKSRSFPTNDQDILNLTCKGCIQILPVHYNLCQSTCPIDVLPLIFDPYVVHYAGIKDPWIDKLPLSHHWTEWNNRFQQL
jgi:lipopolysaccharide biosynthesis glycosyltransferase